MEPIAQRLPDTTVDRIQNFLTDSPWDADLLQTRLVELMARRFATSSGCLSLDDTGFPKQGNASVGVGRQWCGALGKNANCQVGVSLYYVRPTTSGLHADLTGFSCGIRLYLPQNWADSPVKRERTRVPSTIEFAEKWRIGLALVDRVRRLGVPHRAVLADADYGRSSEFRAALREREEAYAVGVQPHSLWVFPLTVEGRSRGPALGVRRLLAELPPSSWKTTRWGSGTKGPLVMERARTRVEVCHQDPHHSGHPQLPSGERAWLVFERRSNETKAYLLWGLDDLTLRQQARILRARWPIEQGYQQMKEEPGLDHFEGRTWPGWHHHVTMVSLAHALLMTLRAEEGRRGGALPTLPSVRRWVRGQMELPMVRTITEADDEGLRRQTLDRLLGLSDSVVRWRNGRWWAPRTHPTGDPMAALRLTS